MCPNEKLKRVSTFGHPPFDPDEVTQHLLVHIVTRTCSFALDGRDPNGFVGVGWSVMGVHDMGWTERRIFGKCPRMM